MQEAKTTLQEMNLVDQFLFDEVMEDQDVFEAVVETGDGKRIQGVASAAGRQAGLCRCRCKS